MLSDAPELTKIWCKGAFAALPTNDYVMHQNDNVMLGDYIDKFAPSENTSVSFPIDLNEAGMEKMRLAWKIAQDLVEDYHKRKLYPVNLEMNFRVFKSSKALMQFSPSTPGSLTCNIQITAFSNKAWEQFSAELYTKWMKQLNGARPHWGKQFQSTPELYPLLRERLGANLTTFKGVVKQFDPDSIFVNEFLGAVFELPINPPPKGDD